MVQFFQLQPEFEKPSGLGQALGMAGRGAAGLLEQYGQKQQQKEIQSNLAELLSQNTTLERKTQLLSKLSPEIQLKYSEQQNKPPPGGTTSQQIPPDIQSKISQVVKNNPNADPDELAVIMGESGIPPIYSTPFVESRRRMFETSQKDISEKYKEARKETSPLKQKIAERAESSMQGIENKERLLEIVESGNLNDPTFAAAMELIPGGVGQRFLSPDTVEYRGALVDDYKDLKTIFTGQTRTAELDILGKKIADVYLTDEQKKAALQARMRALESNLVELDAAEEVEEEFPNSGVLKFQRELNKKVKQKKQEVLNNFLEENKRILKEAESMKKETLDPSNTEHVAILNQFLREAKGNKKEARKLATKAGYKF